FVVCVHESVVEVFSLSVLRSTQGKSRCRYKRQQTGGCIASDDVRTDAIRKLRCRFVKISNAIVALTINCIRFAADKIGTTRLCQQIPLVRSIDEYPRLYR